MYPVTVIIYCQTDRSFKIFDFKNIYFVLTFIIFSHQIGITVITRVMINQR
jgi:hypothetical protein